MPSMNQCQIAGNLTRDPDLRFLPKGTAVCELGIAVNRTYRDANDEKKESVTFVNVKAWGKQAETLAEYLKKGDPILMWGRLDTESWEDKQTGAKRSKLLVILQGFSFLGSENSERTSKPRPKAASHAAPSEAPPPPPDDDDDVPF